MRPWKVEWTGDGQRAGSGEQTVSGRHGQWAGAWLAGPSPPPPSAECRQHPARLRAHFLARGTQWPSGGAPGWTPSRPHGSPLRGDHLLRRLGWLVAGQLSTCRDRSNGGKQPAEGQTPEQVPRQVSPAGSPLRQACRPASCTSPPRPAPTSRPGPLSKHRVVIADGGHVPGVQPRVSYGSSRPLLEMLVTSPAGRSFSQTLAGFLEKYEGGTGSVELPRPHRLLRVTELLQG